MQVLDIQLSGASGVPFYRQVVDQISDMIRAGVLAPGIRMPSVRGLCTQLKVSLITVRRAYADLEVAGLVVRRQGQGTFVAEDVGEAARKQAKKDAREALESALDRALQLGLSEQDITRIIQAHLIASGGQHDC